MSKPVRIARYCAVHAHLTWVITPQLGKSEGLNWTVKTCTSFDHSLGPKYASIGGTQIAPVATALAGSEPKWSAEIAFLEAQEIRSWLGTGWLGIELEFSLTWQVPGNVSFTDKIYGTHLGEDGTSSKKDDAVMSKVGAIATAIWPRGIDPSAILTTGL